MIPVIPPTIQGVVLATTARVGAKEERFKVEGGVVLSQGERGLTQRICGGILPQLCVIVASPAFTLALCCGGADMMISAAYLKVAAIMEHFGGEVEALVKFRGITKLSV